MKTRPLPEAEKIKEILNYDPETGVFTWKVTRSNNAKKGEIAGTYSRGKYDYNLIYINSKAYLAHRLAWRYMTGEDPIGLIDHINGNTLDNRFSNLRKCDVQQNQFNSKCRVTNKSGFKGVTTHKDGKFSARIMHNGMQVYLGYFDTPEAAHKAYCDAANKRAGEFARYA